MLDVYCTVNLQYNSNINTLYKPNRIHYVLLKKEYTIYCIR